VPSAAIISDVCGGTLIGPPSPITCKPAPFFSIPVGSMCKSPARV
jgi:hypothetical protein